MNLPCDAVLILIICVLIVIIIVFIHNYYKLLQLRTITVLTYTDNISAPFNLMYTLLHK